MSQSLANGEVDVIKPTNIQEEKLGSIDDNRLGNANTENQKSQTQVNQPNVRHIPIFVEGRDQPLYNTNLNAPKVDDPLIRPIPPINDIPQTGPIFNLVKDIPVKQVPEFHKSPVQRNSSPARTIPINVVHTSSNKTVNNNQQQYQQQCTTPKQQQQNETAQQQNQFQKQERRSQSPKPPPLDPITKIQNIQQEVLELMDKVGKYKGGSRKDKEYIYLDEMLTQNLLKLDLIDTEGKDNIKAARKEAINCINKCIQVLEAKAETSEKSQIKETFNKNPKQSKEINQQKDEGNKQSNVAMEPNNENNISKDDNSPQNQV